MKLTNLLEAKNVIDDPMSVDTYDLADMVIKVFCGWALKDMGDKKVKHERQNHPDDEDYQHFDESVEAHLEEVETSIDGMIKRLENLKGTSHLKELMEEVMPKKK